MRSRLVVAVAVVAAATAGASAPALIAASGRVGDSQALVTDAERTQQALSLAHALADERDEATAYVAAGRPEGKGLSAADRAPVDRQIAELRADAPTGLRHDLDHIAAVRDSVLNGKGSALHAHESYAAVILELHRLAEDLADRTPPRAGSGAHALADLDRAVEQAEATRGLLLAALAVPGGTATTTVIDPVTGLPATVSTESSADSEHRDELSAAAQQARLREQSALADFRDGAPAAYRTSYDSTVTGPDVTAAEHDLDRLTDRPTLSTGDRATDRGKLEATLTSRIDMMRGAEASLNTTRAKELAQLRDDDVTALEVLTALAGACLLAAVGVSTAMARSLTRPLSVLRRGSARLAADPAAEEPIRFTGRNDEFAQVVRSVNALHAHALQLHARLRGQAGAAPAPDAPQAPDASGRQADAATERDGLRSALDAAAAGLGQVEDAGRGTFVHLALRTLGLVERQLAVIEKLEEQEHDPDRLATLFKLDHFATVMRRHSENLLVLAGADHGHQHPGPVPLVDVVRAAVSEIERYERVRIISLPPRAHVVGFAADDLSHLLAELLENAASFSPPNATVEVSGWLLESGDVMLSVVDEGIGMSPERLEEVNTRLACAADGEEPGPAEAFGAATGPDGADEAGPGLGLYVVARLAARHGVRVQLREQKHGGVAAVVVLPEPVLAQAAPGAIAPPREVRVVGAATGVRLPGAAAEANSNVLPGRGAGAAAGADPLIAAAEASLRTAPRQAADRGPAADHAPQPAPDQYAISPDSHERARDADGTGPVGAAGEAAPAADTRERVTDKGLPKRTPRVSAVRGVPAPRTGAVDAKELRRRLGGFQQGARNGLRDAEAEISDRPEGPGAQGRATAHGAGHRTAARAAQPPAEVKGDTVEEASS
ncbi:sensor histidine kinase [Streptomyces sulfonofaciens]|uniref:sensor histidine kinase n=1 Tax=Streptomyces sulfonofaciens TaxID=68272 RepID=UPI0016783DF2|nr:nitrate- and nitrite sensing domain-containing protein [Streptomyces sulfonofaciens]